MRKFLLMTGLFCLSLAAMADGGTIDGTTVKKITFSGDKVIVEYNNGTSQTLDDMAEVTIDLSSATSVEARLALAVEAGVEGKPVYNLQGQLVGHSTAELGRGVYVIGGKKVIIK